jgi:hypothetical protein
MKPSILFLAASALAAPLAAQDRGPGTDLIDLFEKSQREGMSDEDLIRMLKIESLEEALQPRPDRQGKPAEPDRAAPDVAPSPPRWLVGLVVNPLAPELRSHFDLPEGAGVIVGSVMRGSPAAEAGIKRNDIVVTANGGKIASLDDLKAAVEKAGSEGKAMNLEVIQRGKRSTVKVKPRGPEALNGNAKPAEGAPAMRPMIEIQRRLDQQQREIGALRREIRELRARLDQE